VHSGKIDKKRFDAYHRIIGNQRDS
jgi:hypothetical protein